VLGDAVADGRWLAAGPIQPGIRARYSRGIFRIGNAAGEAHPVVAEGITMAMQSAWLLADQLSKRQPTRWSLASRDEVGAEYANAWRANFAPRIHVAAAVAQWAMRPALVRACLPLVRRFPSLLTWGAKQSGKAEELVGAQFQRDIS
jgi:flavin-dependent dehydrogenase